MFGVFMSYKSASFKICIDYNRIWWLNKPFLLAIYYIFLKMLRMVLIKNKSSKEANFLPMFLNVNIILINELLEITAWSEH